jgi:DNA-binding NarL/FixJ family response regulator
MHEAAEHLKVLIADDHALMRKALVQLLVDEHLQVGDRKLSPEFVDVGSLDATLAALSGENFDLLLISEPFVKTTPEPKQLSLPDGRIAPKCSIAFPLVSTAIS